MTAILRRISENSRTTVLSKYPRKMEHSAASSSPFTHREQLLPELAEENNRAQVFPRTGSFFVERIVKPTTNCC